MIAVENRGHISKFFLLTVKFMGKMHKTSKRIFFLQDLGPNRLICADILLTARRSVIWKIRVPLANKVEQQNRRSSTYVGRPNNYHTFQL